jgi:hypothetical protein
MFRSHCLRALGGVLFLLVAGRAPAGAEEASPETATTVLEERVVQFFDRLAAGETQAAYDRVLAGSSLAQQTEAVKALVEKTDEIKKKYGEYRRAEKIGGKQVGSDLVLLKYLYHCEQFPVVWHFAFYRSPPRTSGTAAEGTGTWRVVLLRFDTDLEALAR